jgi:hypothetical protein
MTRHETPRAAAMPVRRPLGFRQQLIGIVVLLFAFAIQVSLDENLRQLPAGIWSALLVFALLALHRPAASRPMPGLKVVNEVAARRSAAQVMALALPPIEAELPSKTVQERLWADAVDDIGASHHCKFPFVLGPLIFGPHAEVMPVIDACFWPGSHSAVTRRTREIILLGREQYAILNTDCTQKFFIDAVIKAHEAMLAASHRPKPRIGYYVYRDTLTGKSSSVSDRLCMAMPVDRDRSSQVI